MVGNAATDQPPKAADGSAIAVGIPSRGNGVADGARVVVRVREERPDNQGQVVQGMDGRQRRVSFVDALNGAFLSH